MSPKLGLVCVAALGLGAGCGSSEPASNVAPGAAGSDAAAPIMGGAGALPWTEYQPANDNLIVFDDTISATTAVHKAKCDFWDSATP